MISKPTRLETDGIPLPERFVLIDDDSGSNFISRMFLKKVLGTANVVSFENPQKGVDYIKEEYEKNAVESVLLLDLNMPNLSGWDVMEIIRTYPSEILNSFNIYILSSSIDPEDFERAKADPLVRDYIQKPLSRPLLEQMFKKPG